jgi:hypothetical protein
MPADHSEEQTAKQIRDGARSVSKYLALIPRLFSSVYPDVSRVIDGVSPTPLVTV